MTKPRSLRQRLLLRVLAALVVLIIASSALQLWLVRQPTQQAFDHALNNSAIVLANLVRYEPFSEVASVDLTVEIERTLLTDGADRVFYAVSTGDGGLVAGDARLLQLGDAADERETRLTNERLEGQALRLAVRGVACGEKPCQVRVAETINKRLSVARAVQIAALFGALGFALFTVAAVWLAVSRSIAPLAQLKGEMERRSLEDLKAIDTTRAPAEVQPVLASMNALLHRVEHASNQQQAFLADAAHQLRTPLAVISAESELAISQARSGSAELHSTLSRLKDSSARASRLATQLLSMARSEAGAQAAVPMTELDLAEMGRELAQEWVPRALAQGKDLGFELGTCKVHGKPYLLRELASNLIDNALCYGGNEITLRTRAGVLEVEDNGAGIPADEREAVLQRFYRGRTSVESGALGSGLGLAIVANIAAVHGAKLELTDSQTGGFVVRVKF
jgi:two-component system, OmpR family, sensor histidine kinase TctE